MDPGAKVPVADAVDALNLMRDPDQLQLLLPHISGMGSSAIEAQAENARATLRFSEMVAKAKANQHVGSHDSPPVGETRAPHFDYELPNLSQSTDVSGVQEVYGIPVDAYMVLGKTPLAELILCIAVTRELPSNWSYVTASDQKETERFLRLSGEAMLQPELSVVPGIPAIIEAMRKTRAVGVASERALANLLISEAKIFAINASAFDAYTSDKNVFIREIVRFAGFSLGDYVRAPLRRLLLRRLSVGMLEDEYFE